MAARCTESLVLEQAILDGREDGHVDAALVEEAEVQLAKATTPVVYSRLKGGQLVEEADESSSCAPDLRKRQEERLGVDTRGLRFNNYKTKPKQRLAIQELNFLKWYYTDEWTTHCERLTRDTQAAGGPSQEIADTEATRRWASERWQSVYRTIRGVMTKPRRALQLMLKAELPGCSPEELKCLLDVKFRCVWAYQTYGQLSQAQLDDVEAILLETDRDVGGGLVIAYLEQATAK